MGPGILSSPLTGIDISVGDRLQRHVFGLTIDLDIVWATCIAGAIVITLGLVLRSRATSGVPGKFQLLWEMAVGAVQTQVDDSIGPRGAKVVPLALTLFVFIFTCNLFEVLSIGSKLEFLPAPTSDINLPLAMALYVIVMVHGAAIKSRGLGGYLKHYAAQPFSSKLFPVNLFMNVIEELVKPVTLTLRLFGNLFAGGLMLSLLAALVIWKLGPVPIGGILSVPFTLVWKTFDMAIGAIQAFIFALLTIVYFDTAMAQDEAH
ncbi:MAG TPA: F0F1 ATP synthase subunit A [Acidimicrobiales bacterium]|nr:F0F1 ATP synthase subunit A [Acidimicrobiales bacterium]